MKTLMNIFTYWMCVCLGMTSILVLSLLQKIFMNSLKIHFTKALESSWSYGTADVVSWASVVMIQAIITHLIFKLYKNHIKL